MANQRPRLGGTSKFSPSLFRLSNFEAKLRKILAVECNRLPGSPGTDANPLPSDPRRAALVYLFDNIMSKYDDGISSESKQDVAFSKFFEAEEGCYWRNFFFSQPNNVISQRCGELAIAKEIIHGLIGPVPELERIARGFGWGPGASTRLNRSSGDACYKYSGRPEVTPNAYALSVAAIAANPLWQQSVDLVEGPASVWGSRLTTVPKNYKTDRCIAIEPDMNMYLQKGAGSYIRQKLKLVGIDLSRQEANQRGARDPSLATIDFKMASDSVSQGLVRYLLPPLWVDLLTQMRSEFCVLPDGRLHRLSKVSSMGNGFTFELETLIFWSLACACVPVRDRGRVLVYGDDVLIPREYAERFIEVASVSGFSINPDKTFIDGPFRESCGIHIHSGHDITPFYIRRPVDKLEELFLLHNNLRRWIARVDGLLTTTQYELLQRLCKELRYLAPREWTRPKIPDGYGDGAFIGSFAECAPKVHEGGWEYFTCSVYEETSRIQDVEVPGLLVKSLSNLHKRKPILPRVQEPTYAALPSSGRGRKRRKISIPDRKSVV